MLTRTATATTFSAPSAPTLASFPPPSLPDGRSLLTHICKLSHRYEFFSSSPSSPFHPYALAQPSSLRSRLPCLRVVSTSFMRAIAMRTTKTQEAIAKKYIAKQRASKRVKNSRSEMPHPKKKIIPDPPMFLCRGGGMNLSLFVVQRNFLFFFSALDYLPKTGRD